jgi:hypothetical protein
MPNLLLQSSEITVSYIEAEMRSESVTKYFPPVTLYSGIEYLKRISGSMSSVISEFSKLDEVHMASFKYPPFVSETMQEYRSGRYSKDSDGFRNFNSAVTAINLIKACARLNLAIYALQDKLKSKELELAKDDSPLGRYLSTISNSTSISTKDYLESQEMKSLMYTTDTDLLKIKDAASDVKDKIHAYSKKYTLADFEENFVSTIKYSAYNICGKFMVETRTITERATDTGSNILGNIVIFAILTFLLILVGKCATGQ